MWRVALIDGRWTCSVDAKMNFTRDKKNASFRRNAIMSAMIEELTAASLLTANTKASDKTSVKESSATAKWATLKS